MKNQGIYYKVVTPDLQSAMINTSQKLQYKRQEWVYPLIPYSGLFVFDNLYDAKQFADLYHKIFEVKVLRPRKLKIRIASYSSIKQFMSFWRKRKKNGKIDKADEWLVVRGTLICSAVKLIKEVK